ncbi:Amino acid transporter [Nannocystis exedens]|uniref:Amino acid transporter n=1 Tax=Nannocystis exedens TaxID=54 RepID=A0A1I1T577_9BACT|nr:amino acid permease [Nannocystis exedens]PCC66905.1 hypothetical protein NAEX_09503 [Nannocystis exedens]SFD51403.1 Amino acid transporter [Nannocystis exedens]
MGSETDEEPSRPRLSWREGFYLVGPQPLSTPYFVSGFLLAAGVGYATPVVQVGLYVLLLLLAPLYIEAVLLTLSNGGTYMMTRYALGHLGKLAVAVSAFVGVIISISYAVSTLACLLAYGAHITALSQVVLGTGTIGVVALSALPAIGFGIWVTPREWRYVALRQGLIAFVALLFSAVVPDPIVATFAPIGLLLRLNNLGLKPSVRVSKAIFLVNLLIIGATIVGGYVCLALQGVDWSSVWSGYGRAAPAVPLDATFDIGIIPGLAMLSAPILLAGVGNGVLSATGVETVMNIPEELENPQRDVPKIYWAMLLTLLVVGGSLALQVFLLLPPEVLLSRSGDLVGALGYHVGSTLTGVSGVGGAWQAALVASAALMLIGAVNAGLAGSRGLWLAMTRDNLLPRALITPNARGALARLHWLLLAAAVLLGSQSDWNPLSLDRWHKAMFGLVMFSGMAAFILLRKFKGEERRVYTAPWNISVLGTRVPVAAFLGVSALSYALLSLWAASSSHLEELRTLVWVVLVLVGTVVLVYNHRPLIRAGYRYVRRVLETVESTVIDPQQRTVVVAVGGVRVGRLVSKAIDLAHQQSRTTGIPYRQVVVFHMTKGVRSEFVYRITQDSIRPEGIEGTTVRIFTELTEIAPKDLDLYLALVPHKQTPQHKSLLHAAFDALVRFHEAHSFKGHMIMIGTYGVKPADIEELQTRLKDTTLVPVPLFDD